MTSSFGCAGSSWYFSIHKSQTLESLANAFRKPKHKKHNKQKEYSTRKNSTFGDQSNTKYQSVSWSCSQHSGVYTNNELHNCTECQKHKPHKSQCSLNKLRDEPRFFFLFLPLAATSTRHSHIVARCYKISAHPRTIRYDVGVKKKKKNQT